VKVTGFATVNPGPPGTASRTIQVR